MAKIEGLKAGVKCNILYTLGNLNSSGEVVRKVVSKTEDFWKLVLDFLAYETEEVKTECGMILRQFTFCSQEALIYDFYEKNRGVRILILIIFVGSSFDF